MDNPKPNARILDATASNRMMWKIKEDSRIIYIDIRPETDPSPDIIMDCTKTSFLDKSFHFIVFDPPHGSHAPFKDTTDRKDFYVRYGLECFRTTLELTSFIYHALDEFYRILQDDGILFLKWNEFQIPLSKVLNIAKDWQEMMRLEIDSKSQTSENQTYWILLMKKKKEQGVLV